jgi:hypothetical protein
MEACLFYPFEFEDDGLLDGRKVFAVLGQRIAPI